MSESSKWYKTKCCGVYFSAKPSELWDLWNPCTCLSTKRKQATKAEIKEWELDSI